MSGLEESRSCLKQVRDELLNDLHFFALMDMTGKPVDEDKVIKRFLLYYHSYLIHFRDLNSLIPDEYRVLETPDR